MCVVPVCVYYPSVILIPFQSTVLIFIYFSSHLHFCSSSTVIMFSSIFLFHSCVYYIFMFSYLCTVLSNFSLSSNFFFLLVFLSQFCYCHPPFYFSFHFYFFHFIFISLTLHFILLSIYHFQLHFYFLSLSQSHSYVSFIFIFSSFSFIVCLFSSLYFYSILVWFHSDSYFVYIYINNFNFISMF